MVFSVNKGHHKKSECEKRLGIFSSIQEEYVQCAIKYAQPVHLCVNCASKYINATQAYEILAHDYHGTDCSSHFFDLDRLNIINSMYLQGKSIWDKAHCPDCYDWVDGVIHLNLSADTITFMKLMDNTIDCINDHYGTECEDCPGEYKKLNVLYTGMEKSKKNKICYDLQDQMNKTRLRWSSELRCCKERKSSLFGFTMFSAGLSLLAVAFYIIIPFIAIQNETNSMLYDTPPTTSSQETVASSSSPNQSKPISSKIRTSEDSDDDSILSLDGTPTLESINAPGPSNTNRRNNKSKANIIDIED